MSPTLPTAPGSAPLAGPIAPGTLLGAYLIDELCGAGGFATVYRATHLASGRPVAVKVLHRALASSAKILARFHREAELAARLRHVHLVEVIEAGDLPTGQPFLVMEWVEGRTLDQELAARGPLSAGEALAVMEELGAALAVVHAAGVVHRDLKMQNVMTVPAGAWFTVKLLDFGIAKLADSEHRSDLTSTGQLLGTPVNMAPEQIRGAKDLDARADVYALGLLLYQLVTGRPAFDGATAVELEEQHLHCPPPRPSALAAVPAGFDAVVLRCLEKPRERRYGRVQELLAALRDAVAGTDVALAALRVDVELAPSPTDADDDAYDDLDRTVDLARASLARRRLDLLVDGGRLLVASLPRGAASGDDGDDGGLTLLAAACELVAELEARPGATPRVRVQLRLHRGGRDTLLRLSDWPAPAPLAALSRARAS